MNILRYVAVSALFAVATGEALAQAQLSPQTKVQTPPVKPEVLQLPTIPAPVINQNSFFSAPLIRDQLRLTEQQFNQLNSAWNDAWKKYDLEARNLTNLADEQRAKAMQELNSAFNRNFGQASAGVLNAQQQAQFNQLTSQLSGLGFLSSQNLTVRLNLSEAQQAQLQKAAASFNERITKLDWSNPQRAITAYHAMLPELRKAMNEVLTDEQRAVWNLVYGQSFNFANTELDPSR